MTNQEVWDIANRKRHWLAGEEFLAQVAAHRTAKLREKRVPQKSFQPGPFVRTYILDSTLKFKPKRPVLIIPEDLL